MSPTKRYLVANYVNFGTMVLVNLALTPLLLMGLGAASFGLWRACQRFLDFSSMADGRATQALKWVIAHRASASDGEGGRRQVGAALLVWLLWLPVLIGALSVTVYFTPYLMDGLTESQFQTARLTALVLAVSMLFSGIIGIPGAVLIGEGRGYQTVVVNTVVLVVTSALMAAAALLGFGTVGLAAIAGLAVVLNGLCTWLLVRREVAWWGATRPKRDEVAYMSRFSGWTLMWVMVQQAMLSTELILFACLLGVTEVAQYSITAYASQSALIVVMLTTSATIPGLGSLVGSGQLEMARERVGETRELVLAIATVAAGAMLLLNERFVTLWTGPQYFLGQSLNGLIAISFFQIALLRSDAQILDATLNVRARAVLSAFVSIIAFAGAVVAFRLSGRIELCYVPIVASRIVLNVAFATVVRRDLPSSSYPWKKCLLALAMLLGCYLISRALEHMDWPWFVASLVPSAMLLGSAAYFWLLSHKTRERLELGRFLRNST